MKPLELANRTIPRSLFGYNRARVDGLIQDLSDALARMTEEKVSLSIRLREMENRLEEGLKREALLKENLIASRRVGDDIREAAHKEAQLILDTARLKAKTVLQNARNRLAQLVEGAAQAKKNTVLFEMQLRAIIGDHLRLLDMNMNRVEPAGLEAAAKKSGEAAPARKPDVLGTEPDGA